MNHHPISEFIDPTRCPLCGGSNGCQLAAGAASNESCWCSTVKFPAALLARVPKPARNRACICKSCWEAAAAQGP